MNDAEAYQREWGIRLGRPAWEIHAPKHLEAAGDSECPGEILSAEVLRDFGLPLDDDDQQLLDHYLRRDRS